MPRLPGPLMQFFNDVIFSIFRRRPFMGMRLVSLTTTGARSGQPRRSTLAYFTDANDQVIIVGSAGGAARHPAWIYNIAKHPDKVWIEFGNAGTKIKVRPETLHGEERAEMWRRVVAAYAGYAAYQTKTDREIPLVRLVPD